MHPEIEEIVNNLNAECAVPEPIVLENAARILNYMDDINVERANKFEYTPAESLYICWMVEDLEFHIECLKNGRILYTFRKPEYYKAFGADPIDQFMRRLENYLLAGIC
jgi:hypothetical protein